MIDGQPAPRPGNHMPRRHRAPPAQVLRGAAWVSRCRRRRVRQRRASRVTTVQRTRVGVSDCPGRVRGQRANGDQRRTRRHEPRVNWKQAGTRAFQQHLLGDQPQVTLSARPCHVLSVRHRFCALQVQPAPPTASAGLRSIS